MHAREAVLFAVLNIDALAMTHLDGRFWARHFRSVFVRQIQAFVRAVETRLLPAFDGVESEAEEAADEFRRLRSMPGDHGTDMGDVAEDAHEAGLAHFEELTAVRQTVLNLATAALFHLFEQQLLFFHRRQLLHPAEENDRKLFGMPVIRARLKAAGVDVQALPSWPRVHELSLLANTVKHGDGRSADDLRDARPELLVPPIFRGDPGFLGEPTPYVRLPLAGDSVYITPHEFHGFAGHLVNFMHELATALESAS